VYKSEVVEFVTEYRAFVSQGKIYDLKNYNGDFLKFIDTSVLENMVKDFTDCPSAFTLDVGLTDDGRTLLVEVNDFWALGSYGLEGRIYSLLAARRMKDIEYYMCGPGPMAKAVEKMLWDLGVPREMLMFDDFGA
jgi:hypothetical protein